MHLLGATSYYVNKQIRCSGAIACHNSGETEEVYGFFFTYGYGAAECYGPLGGFVLKSRRCFSLHTLSRFWSWGGGPGSLLIFLFNIKPPPFLSGPFVSVIVLINHR